MSALWDFTAPAESAHPSEFVMEQLHNGEIEAGQAEVLRAHIGECADCTAQFRALGDHFNAYAVDERRLLASIRREVEKPRGFAEIVGAYWRKCTIGLVVLGGAAAALMFFLQTVPPNAPDGLLPQPGTLRAKGGAVLHVHRKVTDGSEVILSGAAVGAGDVLRFVVDLNERARVRVVGVESSGEMYTAWPAKGDSALVERGKSRELEGSVTLDDAPGNERLYLVGCPPEVEARCTVTSAEAAPKCPSACTIDSFLLNKTARQ